MKKTKLIRKLKIPYTDGTFEIAVISQDTLDTLIAGVQAILEGFVRGEINNSPAVGEVYDLIKALGVKYGFRYGNDVALFVEPLNTTDLSKDDEHQWEENGRLIPRSEWDSLYLVGNNTVRLLAKVADFIEAGTLGSPYDIDYLKGILVNLMEAKLKQKRLDAKS